MLKHILIALCIIVLHSGLIAHAADKSGVDPRVISLPGGPGSIEGLGESFEPGLNSGTASYGVKIQAVPGIGQFQPEIRLSYEAGYGNGPVGLSWKLNTPFIQRQTDKGLPRYGDTDRFVFAGSDELVPMENGFYRLKIETGFTRFKKTDTGWESWTRDGTRHVYGQNADARIENPWGVFTWMPETSIDTNGNEIHYSYFRDGGNLYLQELRYGETNGSGKRSVVFEYEDRSDVISDYRSRECITTAKRLKSILVYSETRLIRKYVLDYTTSSGTALSLLHKISQLGSDGESLLPALSFTYGNGSLPPQVVHCQNPPGVALSGSEADLLDMNGDSLPDILYTPVSGHEIYLNQGRGIWNESSQKPAVSPGYNLSNSGVLMGDLNGDGLSDLLVQSIDSFGFFKNTGKPWEKEADWVPYASTVQFYIDGPDTRLLDVNNDGLMDVVVARPQDFLIYLNHADTPWSEVLNTTNPTGFLFTNTHVQFADMNGDRMEDLVYLDSGGFTWYLPGMGYGEFGKTEVFMANSPALSDTKITDNTVMVADINGDGLADLLQVDSHEITAWLNRGNNSFAGAVMYENMPNFNTGIPQLRQADMDGDGYRDLLYSFDNAPVNDAYQYVRFIADHHPNLLTRIDNGLGQVTDISYKSSTEYMQEARDQGNPWQTTLPFPVQVVSRKTITDKNSGHQYVTDYVYRDGYYDGLEKEFRGFAEVTQLQYGDDTSPTLKTVTRFDVGKSEESRKGMILEQATCTETGDPDTHTGLFQKMAHQIDTKVLAQGTNGESVRFSYTMQDDAAIYEQTATPRYLRTVHHVDDYGNETGNFNYGEIVGADLAYGDDDILTTTTFDYRINDTHWMLDLPSRITQTRLSGAFVSDTKHIYDDHGNLIRQEKSPNGTDWIAVVRNEYDTYGNIIKMMDANNHSRSIGYDPVFHTFPVSESIDDLGLAVTAAYDTGFGKIISFTDYNGHITRFGYDVFGRLTAIVKPGDTEALPTQRFEYHLNDPVSFIKTQLREVSGQPETYDALAYVDGLGRKLQTRSEGENGQWVVSDAMTFNQKGKENRKWLPYFSTTSGYELPDLEQPAMDLAYDAAGRVIRETNPDGSFKSTVYLPLATESWDEEDNADGSHQNTPHRYVNDGQNRLVQVAEKNGPDTFITRYAYDGLNNLIQIVDDHQNVKSMTFDGLGRKTGMNDPDKGLMTYRYDDAGNLIQTTDNKNQVISYTYDAANRILAESYDGIQVQYHYDSDLPSGDFVCSNTRGRLARVADEAGEVLFSYTPRGNMNAKARRTLGYEFKQAMTYDAMDRMTGLTYPDGMQVSFLYNSMNQLEAIPGYVDAIDYHPSGRKTRFVYANGVESGYQYDQRYRMTTLQSALGNRVLQDLNYGYDLTSNILSITDGRTQPTPESLTRQFVYDDLYRLTEAAAPSWAIQYGYDSIGNLVQQASDVADAKVNLGALTYGEGSAGPHAVTRAGAYVYGYDGNGNLSTKTGQRFDFDYRDRMRSTERDADGVKAQYRYDYGGNRVIKSVTQGVDTDTTIYVDQFSEVRKNQLIQHIYAGDRRVARISRPFDMELFLMDSENLTFADFDADTDGVISIDEIRTRGSDPGLMEVPEVRDALLIYKEKLATQPEILPFGVIAAAVHELNGGEGEMAPAVVFYLPDHLGSASMMVDDQGNVVEESVFYPYGMERVREGSFSAEYKFTGKELDGENELHYFGARYYDAMVGRFVSVDPLNLDIQASDNFSKEHLNSYCYTTNNPISKIDPFGLYEIGTEAWNAEFVHTHKMAKKDICSEKTAYYQKKYNYMQKQLGQWFNSGGPQALSEREGAKAGYEALADGANLYFDVEHKILDLFEIGAGPVGGKIIKGYKIAERIALKKFAPEVYKGDWGDVVLETSLDLMPLGKESPVHYNAQFRWAHLGRIGPQRATDFAKKYVNDKVKDLYKESVKTIFKSFKEGFK